MTNGLTRVQVRFYCTAGFSFVKSIIVFSQPVLLRLIRSGSDEKFCFASEKLKGNSPLDSFSEIDHLITIILTAKTDRPCLSLTRFNTCQSRRGNISNDCWFFYSSIEESGREREGNVVDQTLLCLPRTPECEDLI